MNPDLHLDVETFSECNLTKCGAHRYAEDESTRLLLISWQLNDGIVHTADIYHGEPFPQELDYMLHSPDVTKWAHNAAFERTLLRRFRRKFMDPRQWRCTMAWAMSLGFPGALEAVARIVKSVDQKIETDRKLLFQMTTPRWGGPAAHQDKWPRFIEYNRQDVRAEVGVAKKIAPYPMLDSEWRLWALDQLINDRGMPIDLPMVKAGIAVARQNADEMIDLVKDRTGMENPGSPAQWMAWLSTREVELPNMRADTVAAARADESIPFDVRSVLEMRRELASSSVKKFDAMVNAANRDGRVRGCYQFHGARRTGRWAGRLVQTQNMPRGILQPEEIAYPRRLIIEGDIDTVRMIWPEVSPVLASLVRSAIAAPAGKKLVAADLASIETVMLAWAANCNYLLDLLRAGRDAYKDYGMRLYHCLYEQVTKRQRQRSKPAVLGCGYGLGAYGLVAYAASMGVELTLEEAQIQVDLYRRTYPEIPTFWYAMQDAAVRAVLTRTTTRCGRVQFEGSARFLRMLLPSGRYLSYPRPALKQGRYGPEIWYDGAEGGRNTRVSTYGAKLVENYVQAISRDVLGEGLMRAYHEYDLDLIGHVHDEGVAEVDLEDTRALPDLIKALSVPPAWCADAPIKATGWEGPFYQKD